MRVVLRQQPEDQEMETAHRHHRGRVHEVRTQQSGIDTKTGQHHGGNDGKTQERQHDSWKDEQVRRRAEKHELQVPPAVPEAPEIGKRSRPSGWSTIGTSVIFWWPRLALTTISLANSIPAAARPSLAHDSLRKALSPQCASPIGLRKKRSRMPVSKGLPT